MDGRLLCQAPPPPAERRGGGAVRLIKQGVAFPAFPAWHPTSKSRDSLLAAGFAGWSGDKSGRKAGIGAQK